MGTFVARGRYLVKGIKSGIFPYLDVFETSVAEVSPSGIWMKLRGYDGTKAYWELVSDVVLVETLELPKEKEEKPVSKEVEYPEFLYKHYHPVETFKNEATNKEFITPTKVTCDATTTCPTCYRIVYI